MCFINFRLGFGMKNPITKVWPPHHFLPATIEIIFLEFLDRAISVLCLMNVFAFSDL